VWQPAKVEKVMWTKSEKYKLATWLGNFLHAEINCQCLDAGVLLSIAIK